MFDIAIMSCKGMSVTAARTLVEANCRKRGIPLFVLHDFDKAGLSIASTLTVTQSAISSPMRSMSPTSDFVWQMSTDLTCDNFPNRQRRSDADEETQAANMRLNGATYDEITFLLTQRIELNALTSRDNSSI